VQRPVPEAQQGGLAAEGVFLGPVPRGRSQKAILAMVNLHTGHVERLVHLPYRVDLSGGVPLQLSPDGRTLYAELLKNFTGTP
jgi:hypothetical protein